MKKDTSATVLILHGWTYSTEKWTPFISELKKTFQHVYMLQTPGLTQPLKTPWNLDDYRNWLHKEIQRQKTDKIVLIGHSFGGQLASYYTAVYPEKISRLILIDSSGVRVHSLLADSKRAIFLLLAKTGKMFFFIPGLRKLLYKAAREKDYYQASPVMRKTMQNVISKEILPECSRISVPTLLIWGENDKTTPIVLGKQLQEAIPHATLEVIPEARHSPQFTHPTEIAKKVIRYINNE